MTNEEFKELTGANLTETEQRIIQTVYTFHPISKSKKQFAELFGMGGMTLIYDLHPRALQIEETECQIRAQESVLNQLKDKLKNLESEKI